MEGVSRSLCFSGGSGYSEESHGTAKLEVVLDVLVLCAVDFYGELVKRVVIALAHADGPPGIAALQLPLHADGLGELAEGFFLGGIFQLQQQFLLHQGLYGVRAVQCRILSDFTENPFHVLAFHCFTCPMFVDRSNL